MVNLARLVGPSLAGAMIAVSGEGYCFLIDGISYLAVIASLVAMQAGEQSNSADARSLRYNSMKEGWTLLLRVRADSTFCFCLRWCSLMGWPLMVLMPIFAGRF